MSPAARIVAAVVWLAALPAPMASAATGDYCVGVQRGGCTSAETVAAALARPDRVRVFVGAGTYPAAARDRGVPVDIARAGADGKLLADAHLPSSGTPASGAQRAGRHASPDRAERVEARRGVDLLAGGPATVAQLAE